MGTICKLKFLLNIKKTHKHSALVQHTNTVHVYGSCHYNDSQVLISK